MVQEQYNLTNGGAIRLTVARYYTPSGRSIQRDYADRDTYDGDFGERYRNGDLFHKDSISNKNGDKYYTQILRREVSVSEELRPIYLFPLIQYIKMNRYLVTSLSFRNLLLNMFHYTKMKYLI